MGPEILYDDEPQEPRERTLEMSLPLSQNDDKSQEVKKTISEILLPSPHPMTPNRANRPIVTPKNPPLYTLKRQKDFRDKDIYFAIKWACGILTVAASIVFGIWAPLSYEATIADNDTQNSMVTVLSNAKDLASTANIIASNALDTASAQREAMASLYSTIGLMGQLAVMEFCYGQQTLSACGSYVQGAEHSLESLIDRLGHRAVSTTATEAAGASVATVTPEGSGAGAVPDAAPPPPPDNAASDPGAAAPTEQQSASGAAPSEARPTSGATPSSIPGPTATSPAASPSTKKAPRLPVDAVLGIVFGLIGVGGAMLGFFVWRMRRRRLMLSGE